MLISRVLLRLNSLQLFSTYKMNYPRDQKAFVSKKTICMIKEAYTTYPANLVLIIFGWDSNT